MRIFDTEMSQKKCFRGGTHRSRSPAETVAAYAHVMPIAGITRLANVTGLDYLGVPVYVAVRPNARSLAVAQGKGPDAAAAKASALMEAIEAWHAETIDRPVRRATYADLRREARTIDLGAVSAQAKRPLPEDAPLDWIEGHDLLRGERAWVPLDLVSLDFVPRPGRTLFMLSSNGLASGNHMLEAIEHGLCELIERDASTLWFASDDGAGGKTTQIDLATLHGGPIRALLDRLEEAGLVVGAFDATSDVGVPCYQCLVADRPGNLRAMGYFWGFGCHLDPEVALLRALTEAVQCRLTEINGARDDITRSAYRANRDDAELEALVSGLASPAPERSFAARSSLATDSFEGDVAVLLEALAAAGITSVIAVDLTKSEIGVPVVKVLAPELEGFPFEHAFGPRALALALAGDEVMS